MCSLSYQSALAFAFARLGFLLVSRVLPFSLLSRFQFVTRCVCCALFLQFCVSAFLPSSLSLYLRIHIPIHVFLILAVLVCDCVLLLCSALCCSILLRVRIQIYLYIFITLLSLYFSYSSSYCNFDILSYYLTLVVCVHCTYIYVCN